MRSSFPKVMHEVCGKPLLYWVIDAARSAGAGNIVVVDGPGRTLREQLPKDISVAIQEERLGTADAVRAAIDHIRADAPILILNGDVPLVSPEVLRELVATHTEAGAAATMATLELDEPGSYGRVVRDSTGDVLRVVETKNPGDATEAELAINEVNSGIFVFQGGRLLEALKNIRSDNAQGEYYLPDALAYLSQQGERVHGHLIADASLLLGVNDRVDLATVREIAQRGIIEGHQRAGVTIIDPANTTIDVDVQIGEDALIELGTSLRGSSKVGIGATVGPHSTVLDSTIGDGSVVLHSYLDQAELAEGVKVGPFAYLRPGAQLLENSKAGTFVEIKNSTIHPGAKVPHLSYIGDTDIGRESNIGAGTITANYDGFKKHRTTIGERVRLGVDTSLVAPVTIGDGAFTGAGSVIVEDVPAGALGIARKQQSNIEEYADKAARKYRESKSENGNKNNSGT
jgi:bifunctional UDP-N-acetylglucosamine pyrophosphorylase/glucosamine-1-phosphate N-acetyltransferase